MDLVILLSVIVVGIFLLGVYINKKLTELSDKQKPSSEILEYLKTTNTRLDAQTKTFNDRLDNAARVISQVQKNIGEMSEIGRGMKDLQEFLKSPKLRGNVGEHILKELLGQMLPKQSFHLQYSFKSGYVVDAAIKTSGGLIPIDSKFPMENFRKIGIGESVEERKKTQREFEADVKRHIDSISKKYILTEEGTTDYALMYVPSEAVYYEIVNDQNLFDYAGDKRVLPVSPTTFYAYLRAILMSFEGLKIEKEAQIILSSLRAIHKDYSRVEENLSTLHRHLNNAYNMMSTVFASFTQLGQRIASTQTLGKEVKENAKELDA